MKTGQPKQRLSEKLNADLEHPPEIGDIPSKIR